MHVHPYKLTVGWKCSASGVSFAGDLSGLQWAWLAHQTTAPHPSPRPSPTASVPSKQGTAARGESGATPLTRCGAARAWGGGSRTQRRLASRARPVPRLGLATPELAKSNRPGRWTPRERRKVGTGCIPKFFWSMMIMPVPTRPAPMVPNSMAWVIFGGANFCNIENGICLFCH